MAVFPIRPFLRTALCLPPLLQNKTFQKNKGTWCWKSLPSSDFTQKKCGCQKKFPSVFFSGHFRTSQLSQRGITHPKKQMDDRRLPDPWIFPRPIGNPWGTRIPPSYKSRLWPRKGPLLLKKKSGKSSTSFPGEGPLSEVNITRVFSP